MENALRIFYEAMNDKAAELGMKNSNFATSHGGIHLQDNYSSAHDIAILSGYAMKNYNFLREVCNTKTFTVKSKFSRNFEYKWENTNSLLWDPSQAYFGVKTGITNQAGPCLCVNYKSDQFDIIAVVLHCKTREARFSEIPKLIKWAISKIMKINNIKMDAGLKIRLLRNMAHV